MTHPDYLEAFWMCKSNRKYQTCSFFNVALLMWFIWWCLVNISIRLHHTHSNFAYIRLIFVLKKFFELLQLVKHTTTASLLSRFTLTDGENVRLQVGGCCGRMWSRYWNTVETAVFEFLFQEAQDEPLRTSFRFLHQEHIAVTIKHSEDVLMKYSWQSALPDCFRTVWKYAALGWGSTSDLFTNEQLRSARCSHVLYLSSECLHSPAVRVLVMVSYLPGSPKEMPNKCSSSTLLALKNKPERIQPEIEGGKAG